jgi:hypothetical protein
MQSLLEERNQLLGWKQELADIKVSLKYTRFPKSRDQGGV